ncbi:protein BREAST CANCER SUSCEPTIBILITY 1 homolog [Ziziphus jujuba]|uniref:Protein BREAST CANCER SUSCEPTIBILITY 1 homolog n=1 Tax=Ziziphus jujuba TaxID=326968 RepID=A0A6P3YWW7_ZIZJJ|nr:protein BREAST CANCER SUSCEPTIBILITY 1 homolog [Ziziphus jujuba]
MGDLNHLERMGRELKCPICLSLLNSAVSLNCNHVFCNHCIVKSMKSDSNCPVCKVPYRRREVRSAPHMDSLVNVYKSMEIASGINIFVTQHAPSSKFSDGEQQPDEYNNHHGQNSGGIFLERVEEQKTSQRNGSREICNSNQNCLGSLNVKPSFPTKKRVQVPQCPPSETTIQHIHCEGELGETMVNLSKKGSAVQKEKPNINEKGEPVLSPFFWLREEETVESLSQHTDVDQLVDIPLPNVPSFSDIRDSDDENSDRVSPQEKSTSAADLLDGEMFEWTQRACSPELCSSPFKMQIDDTEIDGVNEKELKEASKDKKTGKEVLTDNAICPKSKPDNGNTNVLPEISIPGRKNANNQVGNSNDKRGRKVRETTGKTNPINGRNPDNGSQGSSLKLSKRCKRSKKSHPQTIAAKRTNKKAVSFTIQTETLDHRDENMVSELPSSLGKKENTNQDITLKKNGKNCKKIHVQNKIQRSRKQNMDSLVSMKNVVEEVSKIQNQKNEGVVPHLPVLSIPTAHNDKTVNFRDKPSNLSRKFESSDEEPRSKKKFRVSSVGNSKNDMANETHLNNHHTKETLATENIQDSHDAMALPDLALVKKLPSLTNDMILQRCETTPSETQCAFCLSSEESEATGEIVHYYNGMPVAANHHGGSKVIHSHKNCTEWAPNVYFKDDIAKNLEVELTRSRRIKCCCCGIKGAALGCFEKSCRKSFHVPCAKLIPQCRWDTDNFVMLCPLHASSKLPSEYSQSQAMKKKCNAKKLSYVQHDTVSMKHDLGTSTSWSPCRSSKKLVLCCSALTDLERESVSRFEKFSGVTVLKRWDSSVTHVIASTDENGACRRTLKVLMGILEGKWILSMKWIKACMEAMQPVDEENYEITTDTHGIRDGPRLGRLRVMNKQPKLFHGFKFYFMGEFLSSYKGYLQDLLTAAGGIILHRKPVSLDQDAFSSVFPTYQTFIIYSLEEPEKCDPSKKDVIFNRRRVNAEALASSTGAKAASNLCILNSIAACKLPIFTE